MNTSVSISKAIGIILMVLGHTWFSRTGEVWINMFHMPLFFLMAGYCFKEKYLDNVRGFVLGRLKGLYVPWVKYVVLFVLLHNLFFRLNIYSDLYGYGDQLSHLKTWQEIASDVLDAFLFRRGVQLLGGFWFLKSLFFASFIGFATIWLLRRVVRCKSVWAESVIGIGALFAFALVHSCVGADLPLFGIGHNKDIVGALFFFIGHLYARCGLRWHQRWVVIPLGLAVVSIASFAWPCSLLKFSAAQIVPYCLSALAGILMVHGVSARIDAAGGRVKAALVYVGNNTLPILTWHLLAFKIVSLVVVQAHGLPAQQLAEFPVIEEYSQMGWWVAYLVVGVIVPLLIHRTALWCVAKVKRSDG